MPRDGAASGSVHRPKKGDYGHQDVWVRGYVDQVVIGEHRDVEAVGALASAAFEPFAKS